MQASSNFFGFNETVNELLKDKSSLIKIVNIKTTLALVCHWWDIKSRKVPDKDVSKPKEVVVSSFNFVLEWMSSYFIDCILLRKHAFVNDFRTG